LPPGKLQVKDTITI